MNKLKNISDPVSISQQSKLRKGKRKSSEVHSGKNSNYLLQNVRKCINAYINKEEKMKNTFESSMILMITERFL